MVSRRTRALAELLLSVLLLIPLLRSWRYLQEHEAELDRPVELSVTGVSLGAVEQVAYLWLHDHDVWRVRSDRRRGLLVGLGWFLVRRRLLPRSAVFRNNSGLGQLLGTICYRVWYGLFNPLPGERNDD